MVRPLSFGFNIETAGDNTFQNQPGELTPEDVSRKAREEFDNFVEVLRDVGVTVLVVDDTATPRKPDAVFPNNWISFHDNGTVITYPMNSRLRRLERRDDLIDDIAEEFKIYDHIRYEDYESSDRFLEGTGSLVLDRVNRIAYACISERTDPGLLKAWCEKMSYTPHTFHGMSNDKPIYHTNVMMAIGSQIAVVCLECVPDENERENLKKSLSSHHVIVEITDAQVQSFAGNMLAVKNKQGEELMVMSSRALASLSPQQKSNIEKYCRIVAAPISTIENIGGGSARCMIAEVFLEPK